MGTAFEIGRREIRWLTIIEPTAVAFAVGGRSNYQQTQDASAAKKRSLRDAPSASRAWCNCCIMVANCRDKLCLRTAARYCFHSSAGALRRGRLTREASWKLMGRARVPTRACLYKGTSKEA